MRVIEPVAATLVKTYADWVLEIIMVIILLCFGIGSFLYVV